MKTEKDREIDDLFKQGLEHPGAHSGNMDGDWDAMEQMLDERKRRPMIIYWLPILGSVAAVVLLVIGWWLLKPVATTHNPKQQRVAIQQPKAEQRNKGQEQLRTARNNKIDTITPQSKLAGTNNTDIAKNNNAIKHVHGGVTGAQNLHGNYAVNQYGKFVQTQQGTKQYKIQDRQNTGDLVAYSPAAVIGNTHISDGLIGPANISPNDNSNKSVYIVNNKKKLTTNRYKPQFAITVLASSDKNGVNSFQQAKPGNNAGIMFSVGVSKRFTVSTGAIYAAKQYMTDFAGYHTNYHFQTDPTSVLADCKMFDIPLNIDYKIFNTYRNKISIGTGVSSYLMLHESYQFNYAGYSDGPTHYNVPNPNKYLLSIINFQATYERQINSNVGITLQPYMKLPLSTVGASQVRLQSTGLAVGLTWNLKTSSTP